ncbi:efflux RND transporter permease subunit [Fulvivirga sedimenti]|uniref:Efflux RND transporter permease subunit n=1 Tax=Fulvivirga sedimenti TaxID=2879465 RepID=A0A9X1HKX8_9BACT|nr:efflux RND transporter permease subunit [Fulvivirga sedimenti]MCA6074154.1 efflux RND transporter permease subunit [Fulvivirga sedimenti]
MESLIRVMLENRKSILIIFVVLFISGVLGYPHLRFTLLPELEDRFLEIEITADEMPEDKVEDNLLQPIRQAVTIIPGVEDVYSSQSGSGAVVRIEVGHGVNIADIQYLSQNVLNKVISTIPNYEHKLLVKRSTDHRLPLATLHVSGNSIETISRVSESFIKSRLEQIDGVGFIELGGLQKTRFVIVPDQNKLSMMDLQIHQFAEFLRSNQTTAIELKNSAKFILSSNSDLREILNRKVKGKFRVGDLCRVQQEDYFPRGKAFLGFSPSVSIDIYARSGYSIQKTSHDVENFISAFNRKESDIKIHLTSNRSSVIRQTSHLLIKAVVVAILGCIFVVLVLTGDLKRTLFISLSIPLTLFPVIAIYALFKIQIHIFILGGAVLGMGLIIDNAIIVIDELTLSNSCGETSKDRIVKALKSIVMPLAMATITTIISFIPVLYLHPISYLLFHEQALTLYALLISSLVVALVVLPIFYLIAPGMRKTNSSAGLISGHVHAKIFKMISDKPELITALHLVTALLAVWFFSKMEVKVIPSLSYQEWDYKIPSFITEKTFRKVLSGAVLESGPDCIITGAFNNGLNPNQTSYIKLKYPVSRIQPDTALFPNKFVFTPSANAITWLFPNSLQAYAFRAYRNEDLPYVAQLNITGSRADTVLRLSPRWERVVRSGQSLSSLFEKSAPVQITDQIMLKASDSDLTFRTGRQRLSIQRIATVLPEIRGERVYRDERGEFFLVEGNLKRDSVLSKLRERGFYVFDPEERIRADFRNTGVMAICGTILIIYILLMFQYQSFTWPLIILFSLPVSISGSLIALYLTGEGLNMISSVGMVVGLGISVNDAILKVDTFRKYIRQGLAVNEAMRLTSSRRIRPILITSYTTVFACLPMYFFKGIGNEIQGSMGIAIMGGVVASTMAAIFFIPVLLIWVQRLSNHTTDCPGIGMRRGFVGE